MSDSSSPGEKIDSYADNHDAELSKGDLSDENEKYEVFKKGAVVDFRNVGWVRCSVIFLKVLFATGVLSIPSAMVGQSNALSPQ
jgi:hypothetical protein